VVQKQLLEKVAVSKIGLITTFRGSMELVTSETFRPSVITTNAVACQIQHRQCTDAEGIAGDVISSVVTR
jgi:hypothetical protein